MYGRRFMLSVALLIVLSASGCASPSRVAYIPEGGTYAVGDLVGLLEQASPGATARVNTDDASQVRQDALSDLRTKGDDAAALADTLTSEFPADVKAVPFAVERATFEDEPAWIVIESWGDPGEKLTQRRLWVFAYDDLSVLAAQSER